MKEKIKKGEYHKCDKCDGYGNILRKQNNNPNKAKWERCECRLLNNTVN